MNSGMWRRAPSPPRPTAQPSRPSQAHSMKFWNRPGSDLIISRATRATIRMKAMTSHIVKIVFEMLTSQKTRPGGEWWPTG